MIYDVFEPESATPVTRAFQCNDLERLRAHLTEYYIQRCAAQWYDDMAIRDGWDSVEELRRYFVDLCKWDMYFDDVHDGYVICIVDPDDQMVDLFVIRPRESPAPVELYTV